MRHAAPVVLVVGLLFPYGLSPSAAPGQEAARRDLVPGHREHPAEPATIEDAALLDHLLARGRELMKRELVVPVESLVEQLDRDRCRLELPEPAVLAQDLVEVYPRARQGVVVVAGIYKCQRCGNWHAGAASGFVITPSGAIVTNYHVVDSPQKAALVVMTSDRRVFPVQQVLAASRVHDLAVLQIDAEGLTALPVVPAPEAAPVGSPVGVISHPARHFYCYTCGVVSRSMKIRSAGEEVEALAITADYAHGSSGAPVLNEAGQVVGIVKSTESIYSPTASGRGRNLQMVFKTCIPSSYLLQLIERSEKPITPPAPRIAQGN